MLRLLTPRKRPLIVRLHIGICTSSRLTPSRTRANDNIRLEADAAFAVFAYRQSSVAEKSSRNKTIIAPTHRLAYRSWCS